MNVDFLYGFLNLSFWSYVVVTFLLVQFTFMGVTLYLHRDATHRSLDLHPALRHIFRFWLWMSSGIRTLFRCRGLNEVRSPSQYPSLRRPRASSSERSRDWLI